MVSKEALNKVVLKMTQHGVDKKHVNPTNSHNLQNLLQKKITMEQHQKHKPHHAFLPMDLSPSSSSIPRMKMFGSKFFPSKIYHSMSFLFSFFSPFLSSNLE